ncbi:response regulator [Thalassotalea euphylliae]|uniref:response regulator n=1 Tax=Thalassotalea euphylliae TaxID=1655234 RepID=UPI003633CE44
MKILVVDDKSTVLNQVSSILSEQHQIVTACNGLDGYEKYQKEAFDLLIIDHLMPLMNGVQLLKNIKQQEQATPIIFMTTQGKDSVAELIEQSLCDWIIEKPLNEAEFLALIEQFDKQNTHLASL